MKGISLRYVLLVITVVAMGIWAVAVNIPHTFAPDTTISSSEVNRNFAVLKDAIDKLAAQTRPVLWARVARDGTLGLNSGALSAERFPNSPQGHYSVVFQRPVNDCAQIATVGKGATMIQAQPGSERNQVEVATRDRTGASHDADFTVSVFC